MKRFVLCVIMTAAVLAMLSGCEKTEAVETGEEVKLMENRNTKEAVYVGGTSISDYVISCQDKSLQEVGLELQKYIRSTSGEEVPVVLAKEAKDAEYTISLVLPEKEETQTAEKSIEISGGQVILSADSVETMYDNVYLFINTYLGWMNAGTPEAKVSSMNSEITIPWNVVEQESWIKEREAIVTLWNINWSRGAYMDPAVNVKNNVMYFTEGQLYEYVKMLKYCGFTGIQVTDMCSAWAGLGSWEAVHEKIRIMADAAHSMDMKFTLWVWGAEFSDCGWVDDTVSYYKGDYKWPRENPDTIATFHKYYDIYADLADCCDRVIAHYYDPGNLNTAEDIAFFAKILRDKFHAVNPDIDFGISCWVDYYDKSVFVRELGTDITLYENGYKNDPMKEYTGFRDEIKELGCRMGTWAWNTCEMEIDQLAQMNFNMDFIRNVYQTARNYDYIAKPEYWSEMDSYHVLNVFSLYCAGQMLINPDIEPEVLFSKIATAAVGPDYAESFADLLDVIQDARTGSSLDTYFWSKEDYILKSPDYPAENILKRCELHLPVLQEMIDKELESYTLPLPIELHELLQLMQSHLLQIQSFAEFRVALRQLEADYAGLSHDEIYAKLQELSVPISNYDCVIGAWGQIEARAQYEMITEFCVNRGLTVPHNAIRDKERKDRIYAQIVAYQIGKDEPYTVEKDFYQLGHAYGPEETTRLVNELVADGILTEAADGTVYVTDWKSYTRHFE